MIENAHYSMVTTKVAAPPYRKDVPLKATHNVFVILAATAAHRDSCLDLKHKKDKLGFNFKYLFFEDLLLDYLCNRYTR